MNGIELENKKLPKQIKKDHKKAVLFKLILCLILSNTLTFLLIKPKKEVASVMNSHEKKILQQLPNHLIPLQIMGQSILERPTSTPKKVSIFDQNNNLLIHKAYLTDIKASENKHLSSIGKTQKITIYIDQQDLEKVTKVLSQTPVVIPFSSSFKKTIKPKIHKPTKSEKEYEILF